MKIIYVYDALCGWCYGFSPVIQQFHKTYKDDLSFEVISGGMITGDRVGPIGEVASYIGEAYKIVENRTGVKFGNDFLLNILKKGKTVFTSIPTAIALSIFKTYKNEHHIEFAAALQKAIYYDGLKPENYSGYGKIAERFELDANDFVSQMNQPIHLQHAELDFKKSGDLGVTGFPTVFLEDNNIYHKIANGYVPLDVLQSNYLSVKNKLK